MRRPPPPTEHEEQVAVCLWARAMRGRYPELGLLFAVPNGARTSFSVAKRLKAEGVQAGVPDLCLPVARHGFHACYVELKRLKRGRLTAEQRYMQGLLRAHGNFVVTAAGAERAIQWLERYLGGADEGRTLSDPGGDGAAALRAAGESG